MLSLFLAFFIHSLCWATPSTSLPPATPFYRSPQSLFASGQANRSLLEDKLVRSELDVQYRARWNNKEYTLKADSLIRDIQVAKLVRTRSAAQVLSEKKSNAKTVETLSPQAPLEILAADDYWAQVLNPKTNKKGYLPLHLLEARNEDRGYFINLIDTYLRKSTEQGSEIITTIPRLTRLEAIRFEKGWMKVHYKAYSGYVDINHFVSRADFANMAYHPKYKWVGILYRDNDFLVTNTKKRIPLDEVWGLLTNSARGVIADNNQNSTEPPLRARVQILQPEAHIWGVSLLEGHGEVWWKKNNLLLPTNPRSTKDDEITTEQLMKRKIYSIAFANKKSLKGLVSAEGIYRTDDGVTWKLIPQFEDQNLPVSIHPDGAWFAGSYKSTDEGKDFAPFIRWDRLAQAIESSVHRSPKILKLTRIDALPHSQIQILVDTGVQNLKLRSSLEGERWIVSR